MAFSDELVVLEGGSRDGEAVPFARMQSISAAVFELAAPDGIYRHSEESISDFRDGQRRATFEPRIDDQA